MKIIHISSQEESPKVRVIPKVLTDIGSVVIVINISSQEESPKMRNFLCAVHIFQDFFLNKKEKSSMQVPAHGMKFTFTIEN